MGLLTGESVVRRRDHVIGNALSERESVMLDIDRGRYFGVKEVGHVIWTEIEQPTNVDNLCRRLGQQFDVDEETCRNDVIAFLEQLLAQGLIDADTSHTSP